MVERLQFRGPGAHSVVRRDVSSRAAAGRANAEFPGEHGGLRAHPRREERRDDARRARQRTGRGQRGAARALARFCDAAQDRESRFAHRPATGRPGASAADREGSAGRLGIARRGNGQERLVLRCPPRGAQREDPFPAGVRTGEPRPEDARHGRYAVPHRIDEQDVHGGRDAAAGRSGQDRVGGSDREAPWRTIPTRTWRQR